MDTKAYHNLDPKLKAAYDRIMGTATTVTIPHPAPAHHQAPTAPTHHAAPTHTNHGHLSHIAYNAATDAKKVKPKSHAADAKNNTLIMPIILSVAGIAFFIFYLLFWLNFFGMGS